LNIDQFIASLKEYFGEPKNPSILKWIIAYLKKDVDVNRLKELFRYVLHTHSSKYGFPSIKELEDAIRYAQKEHSIDLRPDKPIGDHKIELPDDTDCITFDSEGDLFRQIMQGRFKENDNI
jgi:hypothetical protein